MTQAINQSTYFASQVRKTFTFRTKGDISDLSINIESLEPLDGQDVDRWISEVKDILKLCYLDESKQATYLRQLLSPQIVDLLNPTSEDVKYWLTKLKKFAYNEQRYEKSMIELRKIHASQFNTPPEYYECLNKKCK